MTCRLVPILALLAACGPGVYPHETVAEASTPSAGSTALEQGWPMVLGPVTLPVFDHAHEGLEPATGALRVVHEGLVALPAANRTQAREAAAAIISDCPYNRSAAQLPLVVQQVLARHDDPALDELKAAVDLHVAVLEELGIAELPLPPSGTYLHREMDGLSTTAQLRASDDPVARTRLLVEQIEGLVEAYDPATRERIDAAAEVLGRATQEQWPLKRSLVGVRVELQRLAGEARDPALKADLEGLDLLLKDLTSKYC